jgi:hypothetical protein
MTLALGEGITQRRFKMRNFFRVLGLIALVAIVGLSMAACSDDNGGGGNNTPGGNTPGGNTPSGGSGIFTVTGIPSQYNGLYAIFWGENNNGTVFLVGAQSVESLTDEKVTAVTRYSGNDTCYIMLVIGEDAYGEGDGVALREFDPVTFSGGSATRAWSQGVETWLE